MKDLIPSNIRTDITSKSEPLKSIDLQQYKGFTFTFGFDSGDSYNSDFIQDLSQYNVKPPVQTSDDLPIIGNNTGDVRLVIDMNMWCIVEDTLNTWIAISQNLVNKIIDEGEIKVNTCFSPVFIRYKPYNAITGLETKQILGWVNHPGTSNIESITNRSFTPRLLFYRGIDVDGNGNNYPLATYETFDFSHTKSWNYSLQWETENGLIHLWWEDYINFWRNVKPQTFILNKTATDLIDFADHEKIRIDGIDYFYKEMRIVFTNNGIEKIEADLYNVNMRGFKADLFEEYVPEPEEPEGGE